MSEVERAAKVVIETINDNEISITFTSEKIKIDTEGDFVELSWEDYHKIKDFITAVETTIRTKEQEKCK